MPLNKTTMKNFLFAIGFSLLCVGAGAQSKYHKLGFTEGYGFQNYKGDLGNSFKCGNVSTYGALTGNVGYYLNRSFDISVFGSIGDYGYCQPDEKINAEVVDKDRCGGCKDRLGLGNLNSRLFVAGASIKYKFNNGSLFSENTKIKPYISAGVAINKITDIMQMKCVDPGTYFSINTSVGFKYYISERLNVGYSISLGYFTSDKLDFMAHNGANDMYLQNTLTIGLDLL